MTAVSLLATYNSPNRSFYPALAALDESKLHRMALIVFIYGLLELVSLAALAWLLAKKLRYSAASQLAFMLSKQWDGVQIKFVFWVLYAAHTTLEHYGASPE